MGAQPDTAGACGSSASSDVAYGFSVGTTGQVLIRVEPDVEARPTVYLREVCTGPDLACMNAPVAWAPASITETVTAGRPYTVVVDGNADVQYGFRLTLTAP